MASPRPDGVLRHIRLLIGSPAADDRSDGQLLHRFATMRDEAAFEALVRRHGPAVLGVCLRVLGHAQDAEDAFQAAFLVLARKAGSIRRGEALAGWLYRVAFHIAVQAAARRRQTREQPITDMPASEPTPDLDRCELRLVLDQELTRLPKKYLFPVVLCYVEGRTHQDAAGGLGWPKGT